MKVFISWSGELSKIISEELRLWLPCVIQAVKPYFSPNDIEKGTRWATEVSAELESSNYGIIILTKDNLDKPWIMFEAGALSKKVQSSRVSPILFGIDPVDLKGPLVQFQSTKFDPTEFKNLLKNINELCGENKIPDDSFSQIFDKWWPQLEESVAKILSEKDYNNTKRIERGERDMIEEILEMTRLLAKKDIPPIIRKRRIDADGNYLRILFNAYSKVANAYRLTGGPINLSNSLLVLAHVIGEAIENSPDFFLDEKTLISNHLRNYCASIAEDINKDHFQQYVIEDSSAKNKTEPHT